MSPIYLGILCVTFAIQGLSTDGETLLYPAYWLYIPSVFHCIMKSGILLFPWVWYLCAMGFEHIVLVVVMEGVTATIHYSNMLKCDWYLCCDWNI